MRLSIAADQQRLCQWSEEKVALACNCCDLLDWHSQKLTREIRAFDSELKASHNASHRPACSQLLMAPLTLYPVGPHQYRDQSYPQCSKLT